MVRRLAHALNSEFCDNKYHSSEMVIHKAEELVQEINRLRTKSTNIETHLTNVEVESKSCRDMLERSNIERDQLQRQINVQTTELDRVRQVNIIQTFSPHKLNIYFVNINLRLCIIG